MSNPPPPRFRVMEKDRRLVVIDTWGGDSPVAAKPPTTPAATMAGSKAPASTSLLPQRISFDGTAMLTTHRLYDDRAPRTIRLDAGSMQTIGQFKLVTVMFAFVLVLAVVMAPWLLVGLVVLFSGKGRARVRAAITAWLDRVERETT